MDLEISTYWNVDVLYAIFNGVAAIVNSSHFSSLLKFVFFIAIGFAAYGSVFSNDPYVFYKWFFKVFFIVFILSSSSSFRVILTDKTETNPPRMVENVPFILGVSAWSVTKVSGWFAETYETVLGVPDDLNFERGHVGFGHRILRNVNKAIIREPGLRADLMQFFKECTLRDIDDGAIEPAAIVAGTDTWNTIFNNTTPARFVTYDTLSGSPKTNTCKNVADILKERVNTGIEASRNFYGKIAFNDAASDAIAANMYISVVGTSYDWILENSAGASEALRQAMFNNLWREAGTEIPTLLGDSARASEVSAATSVVQAATQASGAHTSIGILAQEAIPFIGSWLTAILFASFPFIMVLVIISMEQIIIKIIYEYILSLFIIGTWPFFFAIINHLSLMLLRAKMRALDLSNGVPFQLSDVFDATLLNQQALVGYMVIIVPILSVFLFRMGQGGVGLVSSAVDRMVAGFSSAGHGAGYQHSIGNYGMGHTGMDSGSFNHTSMHKFDNDLRLTGGAAAITMPGGDVQRFSSDGRFAVDQFRSHMMDTHVRNESMEVGRSQEQHLTNITGTGISNSVGSRSAVQGGESTALTLERANNQRQDTTWSSGVHGTQNQETKTTEGTFANSTHTSSFRESSGAGLRVGGTGNVSIGKPSGGGAGRSASGPQSPEEQRIVNAMGQSGAGPQNINQALTNYRGQKSGGRFGGVGFGVGIEGGITRSYNATHGGEDQHIEGSTADRSISETRSAQQTSASQNETATGRQTRQAVHQSQDASSSWVQDRSIQADSLRRNESGSGQRLSSNRTTGVLSQHDLKADPAFLKDVAQHNNMTPSRFWNHPHKNEMIEDYLTEKEAVQTGPNPRSDAFSGNKFWPQSGVSSSQGTNSTEAPSGSGPSPSLGKETQWHPPAIFDPLPVPSGTPSSITDIQDKIKADHAALRDDTKELKERVYESTSPDRGVGDSRLSEISSVASTFGNDLSGGIRDTAGLIGIEREDEKNDNRG